MTDQERKFRAERERQHQMFRRVTRAKALEVFNKLKSLRVAANDYDFILGPESPLDEEEKLIFKDRMNIHEKYEEVGVYATKPIKSPETFAPKDLGKIDNLQKLSLWLFVAAATSAFFNLVITIIKLLG
jgi:hypothetical protein